MDHHESVRKFEHLMIREADHAHEVATELEVLVSLLPSGNSRQLAQIRVKASHKRANEFRELAQKVRESYICARGPPIAFPLDPRCHLPGRPELFLVVPIREWDDGQAVRRLGDGGLED